jgi:hypothetical protein
MKNKTAVILLVLLTAVNTLTGCSKTAGLAKPDLPIEVTVRKSLLDNTTLVVIIKNNSNKDLQMRIQRTNKSYREKTWAEKIRVPANTTKEFGTLELGWQWLPQEEVTISHPKYKSYQGSIPELDAPIIEK